MSRFGELKYKPQAIAAAIRKNDGMLSITARKIGCSLSTIYSYRDKFPCVREAIMESRELMTDQVESSLACAAKNGEAWAVSLYLKCMAKNRGYVERMEQVNLTDDDVNRLIEKELERLEANADETAD